LMVGWRMRWMWIEKLYVLHLDAGTGVVGFQKALVGLYAHTELTIFTYMVWQIYGKLMSRLEGYSGPCVYLAFCVAALSR